MSAGAALRPMAIWAGAVFVVDQATKWAVVQGMDLANLGRIEVFPPFLTLTMAWNRGINFGLGSGGPEAMRWVLVAVALGVSVGLAIWIARRGVALLGAAAGVVIGGALGNALDRVIYGAVADFLNMSCCGIVNPYAFNVADVAIFAGAVVLAWRA